mmetsp:Transcript_1686/g.4260  ORF Transcript_1686/g.4260 Transcript_1686/m.4260 type:complete len:84 (+) Transcript_1686:1-252(+)
MTWNILQRRLVQSGVLENEDSTLAFWARQIVEWSFYPSDGLAMAELWLSQFLVGGQSPDVLIAVLDLFPDGRTLYWRRKPAKL